VRDAQFVREALECAAVRLATERAREEDVAMLWQNIDAQRRAQRDGDRDAFFVLDDALHGSVAALSGHAIAASLSQRARGHLDRVRHLSLTTPRYLREMVAEHETVIDAVASGDADGAEEALRHHLRMVLSELPRIRGEHPELFDDTQPT
jgi:DNA-binding GntR family transcriptional regulator